MPVLEETPDRLKYNHDLFVNRDREMELVLDKVRRLSAGEAVRTRTLVIRGHRGAGKTWLLREIERSLREMPGVQVHYLDLLDFLGNSNQVRDLGTQKAEPVTEWFLRMIARESEMRDEDQSAVSAEAKYSPPPEVKARWLLDDWSVASQTKTLVLLLDSVFEADRRLLESFEDRFLARLANEPTTLIVMAGRGRAHVWKSSLLRLYSEETSLEPFNELDFTREQLRLQQPDAESRAEEIHGLSGGYPLGSYLLAATPDEVAALEQTASALLDSVPDDKRDEVRKWVEALCVLNGFDEDRMAALLATYDNDPTWRDRPFQEMRAVRDELLMTRLASWDESLGSWVIDAAVRKIVENYLKLAQPEKWQALHRAAYCLFNGWQRQYPSERERWREQTDYHKKCLQDAGADLPECADNREDH